MRNVFDFIHNVLSRRISGLDNVFLLAEQPEHLMTIAGCWRFATPPKADDVRAMFQRLVDTFPRFKQRVRSLCGGFGYWEDVPSMNVADHIVALSLRADGQWTSVSDEDKDEEKLKDETRFKQVVGDLLSQPLDRSKPLWMAYDIRGFADGSSVLFIKTHHCIADGQGSIRALLTMASSEGEGVDLRQMQYGQAEKQLRALEANRHKSDGPTPRKSGSERSARSMVEALVQTMITLVMLLVGAIYVCLQMIGVALHRKQSMKGKLTTKKAVTWSKPVALDDVKYIKNVFGVTVNDVLVSALTAAFRSYLLETDQLLEKDILTAIPVSMRSLDDWEMGNKVCTVWLYFPVSEEDPLKRLQVVHDRMNRLKTIPVAPVQYFNTRMLGAIPGLLNNPVVLRHFNQWLAKCHCVMTNVPGPKVPLVMAGQKITSYTGFVPQSGDGGVGVALISYCDQVILSVQSDVGQLAATAPKSGAPVVPLEEAFVDEIQRLKALARDKEAAVDSHNETKKDK